MLDGMDMQRVWRTTNSDYSNSGYFVWEVIEVVGKVSPLEQEPFEKCRDGSLILIRCFHYWTLEKADKSLYDDTYSCWQTVTVVPDYTREWTAQ